MRPLACPPCVVSKSFGNDYELEIGRAANDHLRSSERSAAGLDPPSKRQATERLFQGPPDGKQAGFSKQWAEELDSNG